MLLEDLIIGDFVVFDGSRVLGRVGRVDAVDILGKQDRVGPDLDGPQGRAGVR